MAKRVYVKRGDVYCIEMKGEYKLFFHYLGNDRSCMGGAVIRVFSKRYDMDYVPDIKEIIKGDVMFYAHAFISDGIDAGVWYKVGHSKDFDLEKLSHIWFANVRPEIYVKEVVPRRTIWVEPVKHWKIWKYNDIWIETNRLELSVDEKVFTGRIYPYASIMNYAEYGYYKNTAVEYEVIKRVPHEYADSYVKRERLGIEYYYHFHGSRVVREIIVGNNQVVRLSVENPVKGVFCLSNIQFGDINWKNCDFISVEEFENLWKV